MKEQSTANELHEVQKEKLELEREFKVWLQECEDDAYKSLIAQTKQSEGPPISTTSEAVRGSRLFIKLQLENELLKKKLTDIIQIKKEIGREFETITFSEKRQKFEVQK